MQGTGTANFCTLWYFGIKITVEFSCYLNYEKVIFNSKNKIVNILGIGVIAPLKAKACVTIRVD